MIFMRLELGVRTGSGQPANPHGPSLGHPGRVPAWARPQTRGVLRLEIKAHDSTGPHPGSGRLGPESQWLLTQIRWLCNLFYRIPPTGILAQKLAVGGLYFLTKTPIGIVTQNLFFLQKNYILTPLPLYKYPLFPTSFLYQKIL